MSHAEKPEPFRIEEHLRADGAVHLALVGELDLAVADELARRLGELSCAHKHVIVSLDRLTFIDSSGIRLLLNAVIDARRDGWDLELGQEIAPQIRKVMDLTGVTTFLWPQTR